jgi:hypothetical protein
MLSRRAFTLTACGFCRASFGSPLCKDAARAADSSARTFVAAIHNSYRGKDAKDVA